MSFFGRNKKYWLAAVAVVAVAIVVGFTYFNTANQPFAKDSGVVQAQLGNPASFVMYFDDNGEWEEVWSYPNEGIDFSFSSGAYDNAKESALAGRNLDAPYNPMDFYQVKTVDNVSAIVRIKPKISAELNKEVVEGALIYFYEGGLTVGTVNGKVALIQY